MKTRAHGWRRRRSKGSIDISRMHHRPIHVSRKEKEKKRKERKRKGEEEDEGDDGDDDEELPTLDYTPASRL